MRLFPEDSERWHVLFKFGLPFATMFALSMQPGIIGMIGTGLFFVLLFGGMITVGVEVWRWSQGRPGAEATVAWLVLVLSIGIISWWILHFESMKPFLIHGP